VRPERAPERPATGAPPAVAVIIPVLNGEKEIGETLDAALAQRGVTCEIVVVDDGCTDRTVEVASSRPGVRILRNDARGIDTARRVGLAATSAKLVAMLDHDDVWHPDHLGLLVAALQREPAASAAVSWYRPFQDGTAVHFDAPGLDLDVVDPWSMFPGAVTATPSSALIRRDAIDSAGGWTSGEFGAAGDLYMWLRLAESGPFVINRRAMVGYRTRTDSASGSLLSRAPLTYVDQIARAASRATRERAARHPDDAEWLARRRMVALGVRHLASGALRDDPRQVARGARLLEAGTAGEDESAIKAAFDQVFWLIQGHGPVPRVYGPAWRALISGWPAGARRTAPYRLRHGTLRPILRGAVTRPSAWRWRWFVEAVWHRLERRRAITHSQHGVPSRSGRDAMWRARMPDALVVTAGDAVSTR
jgi:glycosyltransferase involved in cell wall biosynthesis